MKTLLKSMLIVASLSLTMVACDDDDDSNNNNTNNVTCIDNDGDTYGENCAAGPDCNDNDDTIHENCPDCIDNDGDTYGENCAAGPDCDDNDDTIHENCPVDLCGNGNLDGDEACDGDNLDGQTCAGLGFTGGPLFCSHDCTGFETQGCYNTVTVCGDGVAQAYEQCDGDDVPTCEAYSMGGGTITCNADCTVDLSGCDGDMCDNEGYYEDGWCDPCDMYGGELDSDCALFCATSDGECGSYYDPMLGTTTCLFYEGVEDPDCDFGTCGDGEVGQGSGEYCDGSDTYNCNELISIFTGGIATCADNCTYDLSQCVLAECGDGLITTGESCDGTNLGSNDCTTIGENFGAGGALTCNTDCTFNTDACIAPTCGDGLIEGFETCDGTNLNNNDCETIGQGFGHGTLACDPTTCQFDVTACEMPVCGDGAAEAAEHCDGTDLNGLTCQTLGGSYTGGDLACNETGCTFDLSGCTGATWTCNPAYLGDGDCDCGCGIVDTDCADSTTASCDYDLCQTGSPDPVYNWLCVE